MKRPAIFARGGIGSAAEQRRPTGGRHNRKEREQFKSFTYDGLLKRAKVNLDIFWLKDKALEDSANLPAMNRATSWK